MKSALVTGAAQGLGLATAGALAALGYEVTSTGSAAMLPQRHSPRRSLKRSARATGHSTCWSTTRA
jgi:NAD(P)-dependent dehydrogenase (short-subunit alcohol dehydrogenase family)